MNNHGFRINSYRFQDGFFRFIAERQRRQRPRPIRIHPHLVAVMGESKAECIGANHS